MSFVLAIEPDPTQANILRKVLKGRIDAELLVVSTKDAAVEATSGRVPDLVLVSALLPPRDEDALFAHLRTLEHASHLQTLTIPQLRRRPKPTAQGAFSVFRKKAAVSNPTGCDPHLFLQEVESYLARAQDMLLHPPAVSKAGSVIPPPSEAVAPAAVEEIGPALDTYPPIDANAQIDTYAPIET